MMKKLLSILATFVIGCQCFGGAKFTATSNVLSASGVSIPSTGTITVWYKPAVFQNDGADHFFFSSFPDGSHEFSIRKYVDGNWYNGWKGSSDWRVVGSAVWTQNTWTLYVLDWTNSGTTDFYVNNTLFGNTSGAVAFSTSGAAFTIGNEGGTTDARGILADLRVYNVVLNSSDRATTLAGGNPEISHQVNRWSLTKDTTDSWGSATTTNFGVVFTPDMPAVLPNGTAPWCFQTGGM